jgi:16S rRNA processing protein RimM
LAELKTITIGKVSGAFGLKGWLKVFSFTKPPANIFQYSPWLLIKNGVLTTVAVLESKSQGRHWLVRFEGIDDRDEAAALAGCDIAIKPEQLPKAAEGEYYHSDLIGLQVYNMEGIYLGDIATILATGANDVLMLKGERERAVPFLQGQTVKRIDLAAGTVLVDWDADF